jgi:Skp family chaperone for outer membrane proteins
MNMGRVLTNYHRVSDSVIKIEQEKKNIEAELAEIRKKIEGNEPLPTEPEAREQAEKELKSLRELAEAVEGRNKLLQKKSEQDRQSIFKDVEAAVQVFARARNIDLVIYYNDASAKSDAIRLQQRIATSGMPIYSAPEVDITNYVLHVLNWGACQRRSDAEPEPEKVKGFLYDLYNRPDR